MRHGRERIKNETAFHKSNRAIFYHRTGIMKMKQIGDVLACVLATSATAATAVQLGAQSGGGACAGINKGCMEVRNVVANVTDFRFSQGGNYRILTATVRFTNKSAKPLILGYVSGSGVAIDDQGNRYGVSSPASVRGIGVISGSNVDTKFSLQPGESADTRFELAWRADPRKIFGTSYALEMTTREIDPVGASQFRLGEEYALRFAGLTGDGQGLSNSNPSTATTAAASVAPSASVQQVVQTVSNACAGVARCYDAGSFSAVVTSMTGSTSGRNHVIDMTIRFRNLTSQPIILAYTQASSSIIDNLGNRYYWGHAGSHDNSVQGMGLVAGTHADPQFALRPGESRDAKFTLYRFNAGNSGIGSSFNYDVSIEQLGILASQQIRSLRQYAVHFDNLAMGGAGAANVTDAVNKLKSLFKKP